MFEKVLKRIRRCSILKLYKQEEGNETVTNCNALKMKAVDGKMRKTDCATTE